MPTLVTMNQGREAEAHEVRGNFERVRNEAPHASVCCQEMDGADPPPEHKIARAVWPPDKYDYAGWHTAVPIIVPHRWRIAQQRVIPAMPALPPIGAARRITKALLRYEDDFDRRFMLYNTHMTRTPPGKPQSAKAVKGWNRHWTILTDDVAKTLAAGIPVGILGDFNKENLPRIHRRQITAVDVWVDKIILIPAGDWQWTVTDTFSVDMVDEVHHAHGVRAKLLRA